MRMSVILGVSVAKVGLENLRWLPSRRGCDGSLRGRGYLVDQIPVKAMILAISYAGAGCTRISSYCRRPQDNVAQVGEEAVQPYGEKGGG